jgi:hypothetical protein
MRWLRATRGRRRGAGNCEACGVRDNTIAVQRSQLNGLRRQVTQLQADLASTAERHQRFVEDAVRNVHALYTLPQADRRWEALRFMAEALGLRPKDRVLVSYTPDRVGTPVAIPGEIYGVDTDRHGDPVLLVALDNRGDTAKLVKAGYDLADHVTFAFLERLLLIVVPFPPARRSIADGGWIEARP